MKAIVLFSCDQKYFPLAKGLALSLRAHGLPNSEIELGFVDIGCNPETLAWIERENIKIVDPRPALAGTVPNLAANYLWAMACRPFLRSLFPGYDAYIWVDADAWVQDPNCIPFLARLASTNSDKAFVAPEWHYSYGELNNDFIARQLNNHHFYYTQTYGDEVARTLAARPTFNMGVFAIGARSPIWDTWKDELVALYGRDYGEANQRVRHMAEQVAFNYVAFRTGLVIPIDPLFNYMCMHGLPFRDPSGVARVSLPPNTAISVVHLALWPIRRAAYWERGLLYRRGDYLSAEERQALA